MVTLAFFVFSLFITSITHTSATPLPSLAQPFRFAHLNTVALFCNLPFIGLSPLCARNGTPSLTVKTPLGTAKGSADVSGSARFAVKYASAKRWAASSVAIVWQLPNNASDVAAVPLMCPQPDVDDSAVSEDCLSMILYVPPTLTKGCAPTLMWIHGGSFLVGSASDPGLDGSKLAIATNSIVAVIQYRLGALGLLAPDGSTNYALKDVITALTFLQKIIPSFGGDSAKITVAGQSSGATMIRSLLATPSASSLFHSAIIQSDPMNYGFLKPSTQQVLQSSFNSFINCSSTSQSCLNALSIGTILTAQNNLCNVAPALDPSTGLAMPIRPVHDGKLITTTLDSSFPFPRVSKPLLISTVLDEAGPTIFGTFSAPIPATVYPAIINATFGSPRTEQILSSAYYQLPAHAETDTNFDGRPQLQALGTDYLWKCSSWTFAREWVAHGGRAYVGLYEVGATYPVNEGVPFCTENGVVCHQDDIEIVFGTVQNPTPAQAGLTAQMQARYKAFLESGYPNAVGVQAWEAAGTTNVHALALGGPGEAAVGACDPGFWGVEIEYDYQVYGI